MSGKTEAFGPAAWIAQGRKERPAKPPKAKAKPTRKPEAKGKAKGK